MRVSHVRCVQLPLLVLMLIGILIPFSFGTSEVGSTSQSAAKPSAPAAGQPNQRNPAQADDPGKTSPACALLPKEVIETVQGERVKEAKSSQSQSGSLIISQCFYSLPTFSNSISLTLTASNPASSSHSGARDLWQRWFHGASASDEEPSDSQEKENGASRNEVEKEKVIQPAIVSGLGEEAYWVRSFSGTLYVLKGNAFLRISMSGKQDDSGRLRKAQILARDALQRMP